MKIMKQIARAAALGLTLLLGVGPLASPAQAGYILTLQQVGPNIVATGSGALDITGLSFVQTDQVAGAVIPVLPFVTAGPFLATLDFYLAIPTGPSSFGNGTGTQVSSGSGDFVWFRGFDILGVPTGYVSGDALSSTSLYLNQTFATLGADPGTYVWTWGDGPNQNFTLNIGVTAVPEPSSVMLLGAGLAVLLFAGAIRRTQSRV